MHQHASETVRYLTRHWPASVASLALVIAIGGTA
jgi:hypothetical protein